MFASTRIHLGHIVCDQLRVRSHAADGSVFVHFGLFDGEVCVSGTPEELTALLGRLVAEVERHCLPDDEREG